MKWLTATLPIALLSLTAPEAVAQDETEALEEIVVTAQRRTENIQDVPIAVSALSGDLLQEAQIRNPRELQTFVPSLQFQSSSAASTSIIYLRGVGISDFNANNTGAVGVYADDVFLASNSGKTFNIFDGESVEVLKGPQGTLYGRNTTGGAIKFWSRKPTDVLSSDLSVSYGNYNDLRLEGGVGGPVVEDKLKMRVAGLYENSDGTTHNRYTGNKVNDIDLWALRAIVDFTPTDALLLRAAVHSGQNDSSARQFQHRGYGYGFDGTPLPPSSCGRPVDGMGYADCDHDRLAGDYDIEGNEKIDVFGASLLADLALDALRIISITAYETVDHDTLEDTDASPNNVVTASYKDEATQWSQELRLQSADDAAQLRWIVGAFYFHDDIDANPYYDLLRALRPYFATAENPTGFDPVNSVGLVRYPYSQTTTSWALFGQGDYRFADAWTLTAGLRYTDDSIDFEYSSYFDEAPYDLIVPIVGTDESESYTNWSGRLALSYKPGEDTMFYGSFSTGYNAGGFPAAAATDPSQLEPFDPETLYAYELGLKSEWLDRTLRFNAAAFYYDYHDLQVFIEDATQVPTILLKTNAGGATIYGLETDFTWRASENWDMYLAASFMHSEYKDFTGAAGENYDGNQLASAPNLAVSAGITYTHPLSLGAPGALSAMVYGSYQSQIYFTPAADPKYGQDPYTLLNARLAWSSDSHPIQVALWGKNLTDADVITYIAQVITMDQINYADPRTYGIEFTYHTR